ncbi:cell division protein FtsL [Pandoraea bronchicola]|uniref:Cell division protein FtsL n=1 Tax=Pandoraea bronchicola TaxID=2508287 RepID=A0A5E5BZA8_9BURK|nr:cell division protein FtsL [Pandoraea bronchicola]VVE89680.1 cell division protein FtsL [Pandoraea bronchicola]
MSRLNILLLALLIGCALSLINAQYRARGTFVELNREQALEHQLLQDWDRLQYEQSAQSKSARIESVARSDLKMQAVSPGRTQYLSAPAGSTGAMVDVPVPTASAASAPASGGKR